MSAADNLRAARALIEDPKRWTRHAWGRDKDGDKLEPFELDRAVCFCSLGALERVGINTRAGTHLEERLLGLAIGIGWESSISRFNDRHTHAEVLAAFDKAIELAEAQ